MLDSIGFYPASELEIAQKNLQSRSLPDRIFSAIAYPFICLMTTFKNLCWRIVDPNWRAFKANSRGHFHHDQHQKIFKKNVGDLGSLMQSLGRVTPKWNEMYKQNVEGKSAEELSANFVQHKGTCFGNSIAMTYAIMKAQRSLSIIELAQIENTDSFIKTAQTVQCLQNYFFNHCNEEIQKQFSNHRHLELDDQLKELGITREIYNTYDPLTKSKIDILRNAGIKLTDLNQYSMKLDEILGMNIVQVALQIRCLKEKMNTAVADRLKHEIVKNSGLLPKNKGEMRSGKIETNQFSKLSTSNTPLSLALTPIVMLIGAGGHHNSIGHQMLLQIDNKNNVYILYDNNRGFYQWTHLDQCLQGVEDRLKDEGYTFCEIDLIET